MERKKAAPASKVISVRVSEEEVEELKKISSSLNTTLSKLIREALASMTLSG